MRAGFASTPFGPCLLAESPRGLCHLSFPDDTRPREAWAALKQEWPNAVWRRDDDFASATAKRVFGRPGSTGAVRNLLACVKASAFELRVWRALLRVRVGELTTYGRLAAAAGSPGAARAAGSAVGRNALAYLIPCHRVIRETGIVGGYRWDPVRKRAMLGWEQCGRSYFANTSAGAGTSASDAAGCGSA
jgi:AraC family transcriptional regulator of adaptative response/methylated-DNA-[protein]-cysteine methyltransferase